MMLYFALCTVCTFVTLLWTIGPSDAANNHDVNLKIFTYPASLLLSNKHRYSSQLDDAIHCLQPCEILWDSVVRMGLQELRRSHYIQSRRLRSATEPIYHEVTALTEVPFLMCYTKLASQETNLESASSRTPQSAREFAALTMVGSKGGSLIDQTNQDRAMILISRDDHPFVISGVMDGHGSYGHSVAEYVRYSVQHRMPSILRQPQYYNFRYINETSNEIKESTDKTLSAAFDLLVTSIDKDIPDRIATKGGTTLSIVVQLANDYLFFINTGDSQSFLVSVIMTEDLSKLLDVNLHFATHLHKPDDTDERIRLLQAGMRVEDKTSVDDARVWYATRDHKANTTSEYGLAMSRSLGDRDAKPGVIAEPAVTIFSIDNVVTATIQKYMTASTETVDLRCQCEVNVHGSASNEMFCAPFNVTKNYVHLFVVSATDGVIDYLSLENMAYQIAQALYKDKWHVISAAESLLQQASAMWYEEFEGRYRDDMAITIAQVV